MTGKPPFTPRQILDAGLRSESVQKLDNARQFFKFLIDHHPTAPETVAAREHLRRIDPRPQPKDDGRSDDRPAAADQPSPAAETTPKARDLDAARPRSPSTAKGPMPIWADPGPSPFITHTRAAPHHAEAIAPVWPAGPMPGSSNTPSWQQAALATPPPPVVAAGKPASTDVRLTLPHVHLPPPLRRYRTGRVLASFVTGLGFIAIGVGCLLIAAVAGNVPIPLVAITSRGLVVAAAAGWLAGGLLLVFVGQWARAVFDTANSTRELVEILRSVADPHGNGQDR